jgi:hypothetical protein
MRRGRIGTKVGFRGRKLRGRTGDIKPLTLVERPRPAPKDGNHISILDNTVVQQKYLTSNTSDLDPPFSNTATQKPPKFNSINS